VGANQSDRGKRLHCWCPISAKHPKDCLSSARPNLAGPSSTSTTPGSTPGPAQRRGWRPPCRGGTITRKATGHTDFFQRHVQHVQDNNSGTVRPDRPGLRIRRQVGLALHAVSRVQNVDVCPGDMPEEYLEWAIVTR